MHFCLYKNPKIMLKLFNGRHDQNVTSYQRLPVLHRHTRFSRVRHRSSGATMPEPVTDDIPELCLHDTPVLKRNDTLAQERRCPSP